MLPISKKLLSIFVLGAAVSVAGCNAEPEVKTVETPISTSVDTGSAATPSKDSVALKPHTGGWAVLWNIGTGYSFKNGQWVVLKSSQSDWTLQVSAPSNALTIRIDPPANKTMNISNIRITSDQNATSYSLADIKKHNMIKLTEGAIEAYGEKNPYFIVKAPAWLADSAPDKVDLNILLDIQVPATE